MYKTLEVLVICAVALLTAPAHAAPVEPANFHHVHLNVVDPAKSIEFYTRVFGATETRYAGATPALFTERSFILLNKVARPAPSELTAGLWHIGWGGVDVPHEYEWFKSQGVSIHTPVYPLGNIHVTYLEGPDKELIEVNTMGHHRFAHVHLFAADVNLTTQWYAKHLGLEPRRAQIPKPDLTKVRAWSNGFSCDNVRFVVYGRPDYTPAPPWWPFSPLTDFEPTDGRAIDHLGFSYRDIEPVFKRMKKDGVEIVSAIMHIPDFNHKSFFVRGPDRVLIEIVESKPIPEGIWE